MKMNKPYPFLLGLLGLLATSRPVAAQRLFTSARSPAASQHGSDDFPGQIRPTEADAEAAPAPAARPAQAPSDVVEASDLELAHLQYIKNKVALGMPLTTSEGLFLQLWKLRFPGRSRPAN